MGDIFEIPMVAKVHVYNEKRLWQFSKSFECYEKNEIGEYKAPKEALDYIEQVCSNNKKLFCRLEIEEDKSSLDLIGF